jgi:hypothetical protein
MPLLPTVTAPGHFLGTPLQGPMYKNGAQPRYWLSPIDMQIAQVGNVPTLPWSTAGVSSTILYPALPGPAESWGNSG